MLSSLGANLSLPAALGGGLALLCPQRPHSSQVTLWEAGRQQLTPRAHGGLSPRWRTSWMRGCRPASVSSSLKERRFLPTAWYRGGTPELLARGHLKRCPCWTVDQQRLQAMDSFPRGHVSMSEDRGTRVTTTSTHRFYVHIK